MTQPQTAPQLPPPSIYSLQVLLLWKLDITCPYGLIRIELTTRCQAIFGKDNTTHFFGFCHCVGLGYRMQSQVHPYQWGCFASAGQLQSKAAGVRPPRPQGNNNNTYPMTVPPPPQQSYARSAGGSPASSSYSGMSPAPSHDLLFPTADRYVFS